MATVTMATLSDESKQFYDKILLERGIPNLVHTQFAQKRDIPLGGGRSVEFRKFNALSTATTPLTEGTPPSESSPTTTTVTASLSQYGAFIKGSDRLEVEAIDPVLVELTEVLGEQAGQTLDELARDVLVAGTNVRYASTSTSRGGVGSGMVINSTEIRKALRTLKGQNAKPIRNNKFVAVIHTNTEYDLFGDSTIQQSFFYALPRGEDNPLFVGEIGDWMGVTFVETSIAKVFTSLGQSGQDVYGTLFIGANAYGVTEIEGGDLQTYFKPKGSAGTADPLDQIWTLGWKVTFTSVRLNENWVVRLEHAVTP